MSTTDRHHPFVEHAERRYKQFLTSESQGDTAAYKELRTQWAYEGPTLEFAAFMIHWEDGGWRIGWVGHASGPAVRANGERLTADVLLGDPRFALD